MPAVSIHHYHHPPSLPLNIIRSLHAFSVTTINYIKFRTSKISIDDISVLISRKKAFPAQPNPMLAKRIISNREIPATSLPLLLLSRTRIIFSSQFQSQRLLQQQQQLDKQRFFSTTAMRRQLVQLELFTKENCGLCDNAKLVMEKVLAKEHSNEVQLKYTDITLPQNKLWWDSYVCFICVFLKKKNCLA